MLILLPKIRHAIFKNFTFLGLLLLLMPQAVLADVETATPPDVLELSERDALAELIEEGDAVALQNLGIPLTKLTSETGEVTFFSIPADADVELLERAQVVLDLLVEKAKAKVGTDEVGFTHVNADMERSESQIEINGKEGKLSFTAENQTLRSTNEKTPSSKSMMILRLAARYSKNFIKMNLGAVDWAAHKLDSSRKNIYFAVATGVLSGWVAHKANSADLVEAYGFEGFPAFWPILMGLGVGTFEGGIQAIMKGYTKYITDKGFNPFRLTGKKWDRRTQPVQSIGNTLAKRTIVCLAFIGILESINMFNGTTDIPGLNFWELAVFSAKVFGNSLVYTVSTQTLFEYLKVILPEDEDKMTGIQTTIMEMINLIVTQGANIAFIAPALYLLPETLPLVGGMEISPKITISLGMGLSGGVLWFLAAKSDAIMKRLDSKLPLLAKAIRLTRRGLKGLGAFSGWSIRKTGLAIKYMAEGCYRAFTENVDPVKEN